MTRRNLASRLTGSLIILACAGFAMTAYSQGIYNASTLHVNGAELYINGELINTGTVDNGGLISITGDWDFKGKYKGNGIVEVRGNASQRIAHHGQQISHLLVNGWGTKYIKGSLTISGELSLKDGIVQVSSTDVLRLTQDAVVSGGSPISFIDGALTVVGNGYKFFPIGKRGTYAPLEFLEVKGDDATEYSLEVFENAPVISVEDVIVRKSLYWHRKDIAGSFGGSPVAVDFQPNYFDNPDEIILVTGWDWDRPFSAVQNVQRSAEANKVTTNVQVLSPIIMLGEISETWTEADFYFSTAVSPNALRHENRTVKIFGDRLSEQEFVLQVFNRWGDVVFESASLEQMSANGWDGRANNGSFLMSGAYPFRLTAIDKAGKRVEKKGVITIIN